MNSSMERQIIFRGQDLASNKWLFGDLRHHKNDVCIFEQGGNKGEQVKPDTIGQFTGLHDKRGRAIYEGDIVKWWRDGRMYVVVFRKGMYYASVEGFNKGIYGGFPLWALCEEEQPCEIVGNVYDNKDLLKNERSKE